MRDDLKAAGKFITDVVTDGMVVYPFFTVLAVGFVATWYPVRYFTKRLLKD